MTDINGSLDVWKDSNGAMHVVSKPAFGKELHMKVSAHIRTWVVLNVRSGGWYTSHKLKDVAEKAAVKRGTAYLEAYSIDRNGAGK